MIHAHEPKELQELINKHPSIVIAFGATWCVDCQRAKPFFEKISEEHSNVYFASVDVEAYPEARETYGVQRIPTVLVYKAGQETARIVEMKSPKELLDVI